MKENIILSNIKNNINFIKNFKVKKIGIFGSAVNGTLKNNNNVDILVEFDEPTFDNFMNLLDYLEGLLNRKIDLITNYGLNKYMKSAIENEVVWI